MKPKILIVDDEKPLRDTLARWFRPSYECLLAPDADAALDVVRATPDLALMISDIRMPGEDGVTLLRRAREIHPGLAAILLTAYGTVELAVAAMKDGAADFFQKPITDMKAFELRVAQVIEEGPSGSGKELAARAIHALSKRAAGPFVAVECSAFSADLLKSELFGYEPGTFTGGLKDGKKGCIEEAGGGTLFLDEIGEIDLATQIALLRTLETKCVRRLGSSFEKPVDFRLVAATNRNLISLVAEGKFREDLYYRLNVIDIRMPALKDHPSDIAPLVEHFIAEFSAAGEGRVKGIEPDALKALEAYSWPGNVRQLRNAVEKMVVLAASETLTLDDVPAEILAPTAPAAPAEAAATAAPAPTASLADVEKAQILAALKAAGGNKTAAADALGISRRTLHRKLREWGM